jgi:hypothetical protein
MSGPRRARRKPTPRVESAGTTVDTADPAGHARPATALSSAQVSSPTDERERVASWVAGGGTLSNRAVGDLLTTDAAAAPPAGLVSALGPATGLGAAGAARAERLGVDPAAVRVHTGPAAAVAANHLDASALTVGNHVAFAAGRYRPDTAAGQRTLDHELVHVAQRAPGVHRAPPEGEQEPAGDGPVPPGTSAEADELLHDAAEFHFAAADVDSVQEALDADEAPGGEFWSELLDDPTARARHYRTGLILTEATPADDDAVHELLEAAMDIAADEKQTIASVGDDYVDRDAWAFPETWSARVAGALKAPAGLELDTTVDERAAAEKELAEIAGRLPAYVYDHGLPVPFEAALQLRSFPFRPTLASMPGDHVVKEFALSARKYLKAAVRGSIAVGWAGGKAQLVQDIADGKKVVTPASFALVAAPRVYQPDLDQLIGMAAEQGVEVLATMDADQVDLERYELALAKLAGLLTPLFAMSAWFTANASFAAAMEAADAMIAKASAEERLDRADAWAAEHGYPAAAREAILRAMKDNAGGMVLDTIADVGISAIPVIGWVWAAKEAAETLQDLYDAGASLVDARDRVSSAMSVVALQRGAAQLSMAENAGAVTVMMSGLSALPAGGRKLDADPHAPRGDAPAARDVDGTPDSTGGGSGGGSGGASGGGSGPGRAPDLVDLQQASHLRTEAKGFDDLAAKHEASAELEDKRMRPDRAKIKRELAAKARKEAADRRALADEYASGRRSARSELPDVDDFDDFFDATDDEMGDVATSDDLIRVPLDALERTPQNLARLSRELMTSQHGGRVVYRVDGGKGRGLISVDASGNVTVASGSAIHLNFGSPERALEFLSKDTKGGAGGRLVRFEVSEEWVKSLRSAAEPETRNKLKDNPQLVDVTVADDQMAIPKGLTAELQDFIVPGSGREVDIDDLKPVP